MKNRWFFPHSVFCYINASKINECRVGFWAVPTCLDVVIFYSSHRLTRGGNWVRCSAICPPTLVLFCSQEELLHLTVRTCCILTNYCIKKRCDNETHTHTPIWWKVKKHHRQCTGIEAHSVHFLAELCKFQLKYFKLHIKLTRRETAVLVDYKRDFLVSVIPRNCQLRKMIQ